MQSTEQLWEATGTKEIMKGCWGELKVMRTPKKLSCSVARGSCISFDGARGFPFVTMLAADTKSALILEDLPRHGDTKDSQSPFWEGSLEILLLWGRWDIWVKVSHCEPWLSEGPSRAWRSSSRVNGWSCHFGKILAFCISNVSRSRTWKPWLWVNRQKQKRN